MKAQLILAEAATPHPDGTFSALRAGITHLWGDKPPFILSGALVVRIESELPDQGLHDFVLNCMDADGGQVIPPLRGQFVAPEGGGNSTVIVGLSIRFDKIGSHTFYFMIDKFQQGAWTIECATPPKAG